MTENNSESFKGRRNKEGNKKQVEKLGISKGSTVTYTAPFGKKIENCTVIKITKKYMVWIKTGVIMGHEMKRLVSPFKLNV